MNEHENCHVEPLVKPLDEEALATTLTAYLTVRGMGCPRCAVRVQNGLLGLEGVLIAEVHLEQGIAAAAFNPQRATPDDLVQAVAAAGNDGRHHYQAQLLQQFPTLQVMNGA